ncbi:MAG: EAL domain-containing protein [Spirochaetes bacterium]|nr:EAL domain-containing protein [Spirochaetota bacterium]
MGTANQTDLLLVEDDPELVHILTQGLLAMDYPTPRVAGTGLEALKAAGEKIPDLVLMDVMLQGEMDGFVTARRLRELGAIPIIFLTGRHDQAALDLARSAEAYAYLLKPVDFRELAITLDLVTAKATQERELRRLLEEQRTMFDNSLVGILMVEGGLIQLLNRRLAELFGAGDLKGHSFPGFIAAHGVRDDTVDYVAHRERLAHGEATRFAVEMRREDGEVFWADFYGRALPPLRGVPVLGEPYGGRSLWIVADITEQRRASERLGESERRYRELLDCNPVGILSFRQGLVTFANPMALRLVGADSVEAILGQPLETFFHAGESDILQRILSGSGASDALLEAQLTGLHRRVYVVEIVLVPNGPGAGMLFLTDITEKKRAESRAGYLAYYDPLSGLPNRKLLFYRMELEMIRAMEKNHWMLLILVGLDRFSQINETLGHDTGDRLLLAVSERLKTILGPDDLLSRIGGDEFALLFASGLDETQVHWLVYSILNLFEKPFLAGGRETPLTAGVGVAIFPRDAADTAELFRNADFSLKQAKTRGRNTFQFYDRELNRRLNRMAHLELELRDALLRREFRLVYQPQVDLRGTLIGAEVLLRWNSTKEGGVMPVEFIPIIEENRQIIPIGYWVLEETCRQIMAWKRAGLTPVRVGVNLSVFQFQDAELCRRIRSIIDASGVDPAHLGLEVTESGVMGEGTGALEILRELRAMGMHISLDDFGAGYSSFSKLLDLPLDMMKLDKSFVQPIDTDSDARKIVTAMIQLGRNLNMKVLAEGVETARQLEILSRLQCDYIQGFYFSRPVEADAFTEILGTGRIEGAGGAHESVYVPG